MAGQRKSNRREFLKGRSALEAVSDLLPQAEVASGRAAGNSTLCDDATSAYLLQVSRRAMACEFQIIFNADRDSNDTEAALRALDLVDALEEQLSWFRETSELTHINRAAATSAVRVEPRLFQLLEQAVRLHERTAGAFDITSGPLWKLWGFHRREGKLPQPDEVREALDRVGTHWLSLDAEDQTIKFLQPGIEINLGAIGKGYALDRCAQLLRQQNVSSFLLHGGQSSILAAGGCTDEAEQELRWSVALRHPLRQEQRLAEIRLRDRALGTSGSGNQFFHFAGRRYGHVLDPRTGQPAEGLLSSTVLAPTAAEADALATAFFVMGIESAREFCATRPDLSALFVLPSQQTGAIEVQAVGLNDSDWSLLATV